MKTLRKKDRTLLKIADFTDDPDDE